jgi:hypothetical protein
MHQLHHNDNTPYVNVANLIKKDEVKLLPLGNVATESL